MSKSSHTSYDIEARTLEISEYLETKQLRKIVPRVKELHPSDVAKIIQYLSPSLRIIFIHKVWSHIEGGEVLAYLDEGVREELTDVLGHKELASAVKELESDDAFSVLDDLSDEQKEAVLASIDPIERQRFEALQHYPKDSAARLMQEEMIAIPPTWTVKEVLHYIASNKNLPRTFYDIHLVNEDWTLIGCVSLADVMRASANTPMEHLEHDRFYAISALEDQEKIALHFKNYSLISAPVVDDQGHLLGVITADDVLDIADKEAEEDIMHLGGISASDFYAPILPTTIARFQWLLITFVNTLLASVVISQFQMVLEKKVALAVLMPIVAAMGGNAGMQVVTVVVRAIATGELSVFNMGRTLFKSFIVSFLNGAIFALLLSLITIWWFNEISLGVVLGCAMLVNMLWAGLAGTLLPVITHRIGLDPALSAGPILTTTTDVIGFSIFLGLAKNFLF